ncbi:MAG: CPBP family intramembrane metalloprotease [Anaerolineales bacterium]|nr:CPBP family intramembrane metalloprotease [Anaerolineales bacterium]
MTRTTIKRRLDRIQELLNQVETRSIGLTVALAHAFVFWLVTGIAGAVQDPLAIRFGLNPADPFTREFLKLVFLDGSIVLLYLLTLPAWRKAKTSINWGLQVKNYRGLGFFIGMTLGILAQYLFVRMMESAGYWIKDGSFGVITVAGFIPVILTAFSEELAYRAYLFQTTAKLAGVPVALFISAFAFGIAHIQGHSVEFGIPPGLAFIPAFLGGLTFTYAYRINNNLWLPMGLHFAWNYFGGVFGSIISPETPAMLKLLVQMMVLVGLIAIFVEWMLWLRRAARPTVSANQDISPSIRNQEENQSGLRT